MEDTTETVAIIIFIGAGMFSILAGMLNWNFFFESKQTLFFQKFLGRNGTRVFYVLLGLFLCYNGYSLILI